MRPPTNAPLVLWLAAIVLRSSPPCRAKHTGVWGSAQSGRNQAVGWNGQGQQVRHPVRVDGPTMSPRERTSPRGLRQIHTEARTVLAAPPRPWSR